MRLVAPGDLRWLFDRHGLGERRACRLALRDGKAFHVALFGRR